MKNVSLPGWMDENAIDLCRRCHFVWINPDKFKKIPHPEDLIVAEGDSSVLKERLDGATKFYLESERIKEAKESIVGDGPESLLRRIPGFIGLPTEMSDHGVPTGAALTLFFCFVLFAIHLIASSFGGSGEQTLLESGLQTLIQEYGFYPSQFFKNFGLNVFTAAFLHADWFHLLTNLYFFWMFSDDIELDLGRKKYLWFFATICLFTALSKAFLKADQEIPSIGLSAVIMGFMIYYACRFPKSRMAYLLPVLHNLPIGNGGFSLITGLRWFRFPVWSVTLFYVGKDILYYALYEKNQLTNVGHSAHLFGALAGFLFWWFIRRNAQRAEEEIERKLLQKLKKPKHSLLS